MGHLRDLPGDTPETAHLSGIAEAVPATGRAAPGLRLTLTAYAYFLEHEGRLEEAIDTARQLSSCYSSSGCYEIRPVGFFSPGVPVGT